MVCTGCVQALEWQLNSSEAVPFATASCWVLTRAKFALWQAIINIISNPVNSTVPITAEVLKAAGKYDPRKVSLVQDSLCFNELKIAAAGGSCTGLIECAELFWDLAEAGTGGQQAPCLRVLTTPMLSLLRDNLRRLQPAVLSWL